MRKNIKVLLISIVGLLVFGCTKDYLEKVPTDAISTDAVFSSPDNMLLALNGLHRQMYAQSPLDGYNLYYNSGESHFIPSFDAIGGNVIHSSPGNGWMRDDLQWKEHTDPNSATAYGLWYERYHFIATSSGIINRGTSGEFTIDDKMSDILGQAYAYRAWSYWRLITSYAKGYLVGNPSTDPGVPLLLEQGAPYDGGPRATVAEVYAQIEDDINKAIDYLKNGVAHTGDNAKSHISLNAAYGIKARVALSKGDWAVAAESAVKARQGYPIMDRSAWESGFNTVDLSEVIWGGHVIDAETNYFASYFYYIGTTFNGSQNRSNPKIISKTLYNQIPVTDYRRDAWLPLAPNTNPAASDGEGGSSASDPNYDNDTDFWNAWLNIINTYGMTTGHNTHPYMSVKFLQQNPGTIDPDDVIYMRSSEMVLIEAEAKAMQNDIAGAQNALAILGEARDSAFDKTSFGTKQALMDEIKFQRGVELWGEGFSFHDHIRWDEELDETGTGAAEVLYQDGFHQDRPSVNPKWVWKIPQAEIDANPNISEADQNKY